MERIPRWLARIGLLLACMALAACGTSRTTIAAAPQSHQTLNSLTMVEGNSTVAVPEQVKANVRKQLEKALYEKSKFARGDELTLRYRYVQFTAGDRFQRWFFGGVGNAGEASITVECVFVDRNGGELARIMSEGRIGSGFFGGSVDSALEKLAEDIANYTVQTFR
jgi:hypothetical protein